MAIQAVTATRWRQQQRLLIAAFFASRHYVATAHMRSRHTLSLPSAATFSLDAVTAADYAYYSAGHICLLYFATPIIR